MVKDGECEAPFYTSASLLGPWAVPEGVKCPRERRADGVVTTLGPADLGHSYTGYKPGDKQKNPQSQPAPSQVP